MSAYLVEFVVAGVVVLHNGAVAGHVVGVGESPTPLWAVVLAADVKQVAVKDDGVTWRNKRQEQRGQVGCHCVSELSLGRLFGSCHCGRGGGVI